MPIKAEKWTILDENDENSEEYGNDYDYYYGNDYDNDNYYGSVEVKCTTLAGKAFYTSKKEKLVALPIFIINFYNLKHIPCL